MSEEPKTIEDHMEAHRPDFPTPEMEEAIARDYALWIESSLESTLSDQDRNVLARGRIARDQTGLETLSFWPVPPSIPARLRSVEGGQCILRQEGTSEDLQVVVAALRDEPPRHPVIVLHRR